MVLDANGGGVSYNFSATIRRQKDKWKGHPWLYYTLILWRDGTIISRMRFLSKDEAQELKRIISVQPKEAGRNNV